MALISGADFLPEVSCDVIKKFYLRSDNQNRYYLLVWSVGSSGRSGQYNLSKSTPAVYIGRYIWPYFSSMFKDKKWIFEALKTRYKQETCVRYWSLLLHDKAEAAAGYISGLLASLRAITLYNTFKNEYTASCCLEFTSKLNERKELVKLKIGNHKLMIETSRYDNIPRVNGLWSTCGPMRLKMNSFTL